MREQIDNKAKPFLKWAGGKTQLISEIQGALPYNFSDNITTYVEPFVGGGAVLFWILQNYPNIERAIINDINKDLISAYITIKDQPNDLINLLQIIKDEFIGLNEQERKKYFLEKRTLYNTKELDMIENTALLIL